MRHLLSLRDPSFVNPLSSSWPHPSCFSTKNRFSVVPYGFGCVGLGGEGPHGAAASLPASGSQARRGAGRGHLCVRPVGWLPHTLPPGPVQWFQVCVYGLLTCVVSCARGDALASFPPKQRASPTSHLVCDAALCPLCKARRVGDKSHLRGSELRGCAPGPPGARWKDSRACHTGGNAGPQLRGSGCLVLAEWCQALTARLVPPV